MYLLWRQITKDKTSLGQMVCLSAKAVGCTVNIQPKFGFYVMCLSFLHFLAHVFFFFQLPFLFYNLPPLLLSYRFSLIIFPSFLLSVFFLQSKCVAIPGRKTYFLSHRYSRRLGRMPFPKMAALYICETLVITAYQTTRYRISQ